MATADHSRRARQQELRRLLAELATSGKKWHVINEGLAGRGAGRLVLRPGADGAAPRRTTGQRLPAADGHIASWYFRYTDSAGKRPWMYIGVCDPTRKAGLDLDDALFEARKLSEELRGPAGGDLIRHRAQEQRRKEEALDEQRRLEAQEGKTLRLLLETYIEWLRKQEKHGSAYDVASLLRIHLFEPWPALCAKPAAQVKRAELTDVVRAIHDAGKERTAGKVRSFISAAFEAALIVGNDATRPAAFKDFGIEHNPAAGVKYKGAGIRARNRKLTPEELGRLLVLLRKETSPAAKALRILIDLGGQRQEQLWRVGIADVDLNRGTLVQQDPKGNRDEPRIHEVPLLGRTLRQVAALVKASQCMGSSLLFTTNGVVPIRDETVRELFRALATAVCALNDNQVPRFGLSDLRRTVESELGTRGYVREHRGWLLSHGFSGVQARHYERIAADNKMREMLRDWQAYLLQRERIARRDIRKRAAAGDQRYAKLLNGLADAKPALARARSAQSTGASQAVKKLSVVPRNTAADPLLRIEDVLTLLPISESTLRKLRQSGEFPPPSLHLGRTPVWRRSEVDRFLEGAMAKERAPSPPSPRHLQLVGR